MHATEIKMASIVDTLTENLILPRTMQAADDNHVETEKLVNTTCAAFSHAEGSTAEELSEFLSVCRGLAGLISPVPGICGCSAEDITAASTPPEDAVLATPTGLLCCTANDNAVWVKPTQRVRGCDDR